MFLVRKTVPTYKTEEWVRDAKIGILFKKISTCMKEGKAIEFEGFGINNTPYSKLVQDEWKPKQDLKSNLNHIIISEIREIR